ncbi:MAG: hypothetical protein WBA97_02625 [Actinophytocola sp.]|uniref:hypothetical protein n=1 Tax=Actinophytocola sp. TaxID=1872138 RepID=UPI003C76E3E7
MTTTADRQAASPEGLAMAIRRSVPLLPDTERSSLRPELLDVIENRKSGLSANWIVGCPLDCGYCVRHLIDNFGMKVP